MSGPKKIKQETIKVCVRARPLLQHEDVVFWVINQEKNTICTLNNKDSMNYLNNNENKDFKKALLDSIYLPQNFTFDKLYNESTTSESIYKDIGKPIIRSVIKGYNGNIFMYGQTTSGKTYTMLGVPNSPGIIPCALRDIFRQTAKVSDAEYIIYCSYIEIYNENIFDLLNNSSNSLKLFEDSKYGVQATEAKKQMISSFEDAIQLLNNGEENRRYRSTVLNEYSSRSHTIFQIFVEVEYPNKNNEEKIKNKRFSCLNLVDLAGSERVTEYEGKDSSNGETGYINKSLFVLGNVINKLADTKNSYIPYRDSKLTRLLSHGLGGNSLTTIICTISPASVNYNQTLSTLRFATRAKKVSNKASINELEKDNLDHYKKEILKLKNDLNKNKVDHKEILHKILNTNESISKELDNYKEKYDHLKEKNINLKKELNEMKSQNERENPNDSQKEKDFFSPNSKKKKKSTDIIIDTNSTRKFNQNDSNNVNVSPWLNRININNTGDSQFLDTTTKKMFANFPEEKKNREDNIFLENVVKDLSKVYDIKLNNENFNFQFKNISLEYQNELLLFQNKYKEKLKDLCAEHFNKNIDVLNKDETCSKKGEKNEEPESIVKMIENNTVFKNIELNFKINNNENYEYNAKLLKKNYDEKIELIEKSMENCKSHLENYFRKKLQHLKNYEILNNECGKIPIVTITNEHHENLKLLRTLYDDKINQVEKKFFEILKKITKEKENERR